MTKGEVKSMDTIFRTVWGHTTNFMLYLTISFIIFIALIVGLIEFTLFESKFVIPKLKKLNVDWMAINIWPFVPLLMTLLFHVIVSSVMAILMSCGKLRCGSNLTLYHILLTIILFGISLAIAFVFEVSYGWGYSYGSEQMVITGNATCPFHENDPFLLNCKDNEIACFSRNYKAKSNDTFHHCNDQKSVCCPPGTVCWTMMRKIRELG